MFRRFLAVALLSLALSSSCLGGFCASAEIGGKSVSDSAVAGGFPVPPEQPHFAVPDSVESDVFSADSFQLSLGILDLNRVEESPNVQMLPIDRGRFISSNHMSSVLRPA